MRVLAALQAKLSALQTVQERDSLTVAVTVGSWQQIGTLLDSVASRHPGLASWLVTNAIPTSTATTSTPLPGHIDCARRLRHALATLVTALGPVGGRLGLTDESGHIRTIGAFVEGRSVTMGMRTDGNADTDAVQLPRLDPHTRKGPDGSTWGGFRVGHPPADFMAWPWQWGLAWVSQGLERLLGARALPLPATKPFQDERRWQLARAMCHSRAIAHQPLSGTTLLVSAEQLLDSMRAKGTVRLTWSGGGRNVDTTPDEITALIQQLKEPGTIADDGQLHRPYPVPDAIPPLSNTIGSIYSDNALRLLVEQVYANTLVLYQDLVTTWFPTLAPMLGLACVLPVLLTGRVMPRGDSLGGPDFVYHMEPLPLTEPSRAEVSLATTDKELLGYDPGDLQAMMVFSLRLRQLVTTFRPGVGGWANPRSMNADLWVWGDRPATALAHRWLWEDLRALHMIKKMPLYGED